VNDSTDKPLGMARPSEADSSGQTEATDLTPPSPFATARNEPGWQRTRLRAPPEIAGYELREELGHGGMGVVYKAWQTSLKRPVAIKMIISGQHASAEERERFRIEAEAAARLQHPNIVQIYEIGEQNGLPYFVMELIAGQSLSHSRAGTPQPPREAAELVESLALAIQHAHERGIIHRDLKPGNVLLQPSGSGLPSATPDAQSAIRHLQAAIPKITDFGLAKRVEAEGDPTCTGAVLGTPSYMAPEQARGQRELIGPATDIYALGSILYELLTGRPPFKGATPLDTMEQVRTQEPIPPSRFQSKLPRDLETICLKCLQKESSRRYATAAALANDLRRFLKGESIVARPVGAGERAWKWARRRPAAALLIGVSVLAVMASIFAGVQHNLRVEAERARAQKNLHRSLQAIDQMLTRVADSSLRNVPQATPVRKSLILEAERLILELLQDDPHDPEVRLRAGNIYRKMGQMYQYLDVASDQAAQAYERANGYLTALAAEHPKRADVQRELAGCCYNQAALLRSLGRPDEALTRMREAIALRQPLADAGLEAEDRLQLAIYEHMRGWILHGRWARHGKSADAEAAEDAYERMRVLLEALHLESPQNQAYRQELARAHHFLSWLTSEHGRVSDAEAHHLKALPLREALVRESPGEVAYQEDLGHTYNNLALLYGNSQRPKEAEETYRRAVSLWDGLVQQFTAVPDYKSMAALARNNLVWVHLQNDPPLDECLEMLTLAVRLQGEALAVKSDVADYRTRMLFHQHNLAEVQIRRKAHAAAVEAAVAGLELTPNAAEHFTAAGYLARCVPLAAADSALPHAERGRLAEGYADRALELLREAVQRGFDNVSALRNEADFQAVRAREDFRKLVEDLERRVPLPPGESRE